MIGSRRPDSMLIHLARLAGRGRKSCACARLPGETNRTPACATRHENGPHFVGHSGARAPPASPETMNTTLADRVHEPVFMVSGPGPHGPPRHDGLPLECQRFSPLFSWQ